MYVYIYHVYSGIPTTQQNSCVVESHMYIHMYIYICSIHICAYIYMSIYIYMYVCI